jgi:hypothetical protein
VNRAILQLVFCMVTWLNTHNSQSNSTTQSLVVKMVVSLINFESMAI